MSKFLSRIGVQAAVAAAFSMPAGAANSIWQIGGAPYIALPGQII